MKTQLFTELDMVGKTIVYADTEDGMFISFSDNTFVYLSSQYDSSYINLSDTFDQYPTTRNYVDLFNKGIIDEKTFNEYNNKKIQESSKWNEQQKQNEIAKLKELKAKYPEL